MKILHINTYDSGGAARAAIRLHLGLLEYGIDSRLMLRYKSKSISRSFVFRSPPVPIRISQRIIIKIRRILTELWILKIRTQPDKIETSLEEIFAHRPKGLELISLPLSTTDITKSDLYLEADIIHFHWVANFLDWQSFFQVNKKPIVWTLHDQNPFFGFEHYDERYFGINKFGFPLIREKNITEKELSEKWLSFKKHTFPTSLNLTIVAPSMWLLNSSIISDLFNNFPHHYIPNGFQVDIFKPLDKKFSRSVLNLPIEKKIILFVAESISNSRKGFNFLKEAFSLLRNESNICICAIGSIESKDSFEKIIYLGDISNEELMAVAYSAADVFVIPSLEDNLPNTMIESLLCGTPVIGFPVGGIQETIIDSNNGYICSEISVNALVERIKYYFLNMEVFNSDKIALDAREKFALNIQAEQYIKLYKDLLPDI